MSSEWNVKGKRCLVTGATSGIGEATALGLARAGANVTLVARNATKAAATRARLAEVAPDSPADIVLCDFASFASIRAAAEEILAAYPRIDCLVNNAGVFILEREETTDGIESTFAVNHLGYFLFTRLLLQRLLTSAPARIVNVASHAHKFVSLDLDNLEPRENYSGMAAYGISKACNILFTGELARRIDGTGVTANSLHPGGVSTGLGSNNTGWLSSLIRPIAMLVMKTPDKGAHTSLHLAMSDSLSQTSGLYFANRRVSQPKAFARDPETAQRLWKISEQLCGLEPFSLPN